MFSTLDDREVDGLLMGKPSANADLAPLVELVASLRRSAADEPVPTMGERLRDQLRATAVVPITMGQAGRSALFKAAAAAAIAAVVGLGVGASQNRLPSGLQDVLSSTADIVGIHVPAASERGREDPGQGGGSSNRNDDGEPGGGNENSTGGATPADPGTPGDRAPATPATPPEQGNGTPGDDGTVGGSTGDPGGGHAPAQPVPSTVPQPPSTVPQPPSTVPQPPSTVPEPARAEEPEEEPTTGAASRGNPSEAGAEHGVGAMNAPGGPPEELGGGRPAEEPGRPA